MRFFYILLVGGIIFTFIPDSAATAKGAEFSISFDKKVYAKNDPINVTFSLKNTGKKPLYVNKRFYINSIDSPAKDREVYFEVISPVGERMPYVPELFKTGLPKSDYFVLLDAGEEATADRPRNIKGYFDFSAAGTYKITAVYHNVYGKEIGLDAFSDKARSETVEIRIVEKAPEQKQ